MQKIFRFWWVAALVIMVVIVIAATNWMGKDEAQDVTLSVTIPASVAVVGSDADKGAVLNIEPRVIERQMEQDAKVEPAAKAVVVEEVDVEYEAPVRGPLTQ